MRFATLFVSVLISVSLSAQTGRPIPVGVREADHAQDQFERNSVPPAYQSSSVDFSKLQHDAQELAELSKSIPPDIDQTTKGMFPKDLEQKLKRIEKLAKQLRSQISN